MARAGLNRGIGNFLQVATRAVTRPTRIITGGLAIGAAVALPTIAIPALLGGLVAVVAMSWSDINDPEFINQTLRPDSAAGLDINQQLQFIQQRLGQLKIDSMDAAVSSDITEAKQTITKITRTINDLAPAERGSVAFVVEQLVKLVDRLINLSQKEQIARQFLTSEDRGDIGKEIDKLGQALDSQSDKVAKQQISKVLAQKQAQLASIDQVSLQLTRIDAHIANIRAVLSNTYTNLTKLRLQDDYSLVDEADILSEGMEQLVAEIDVFESNKVNIPVDIAESTIKSKTEGVKAT